MVGWVFFRAETLPRARWASCGRWPGCRAARGRRPTACDATSTPATVLAFAAGVDRLDAGCPRASSAWRARAAAGAAGGAARARRRAGCLLLAARLRDALAAGTYNPFIYFRF